LDLSNEFGEVIAIVLDEFSDVEGEGISPSTGVLTISFQALANLESFVSLSFFVFSFVTSTRFALRPGKVFPIVTSTQKKRSTA
jgi:hypothetical protein